MLGELLSLHKSVIATDLSRSMTTSITSGILGFNFVIIGTKFTPLSRHRTESVLAWNKHLRFCIEQHPDFPSKKQAALDYPFLTMASSLYGESRRKYSWWWDSHISPKNSKWLQDNLTDMDRNVKAMIKLIEEDADSFANRTEMYYKKRPELMKIVEEFYRAYRTLAERYDHATGALRQAHKTMAEAFPNQIPPMMSDDSPSSITEFYPFSPEMSSPIHRFSDFDDSSSNKKGLKQLKEMFPSTEGSVKKALSFKEEEKGFKSEMKHLHEEISQLSLKNENLMREMTLESQRAQALQEIVYECESGKEDALCGYRNSIERISILESGISNTRHELNEVSDQMTVQLNSVEEQFHAMESVSRSVRLKLETQQKELNKKELELEELCVVIGKEQEKRLEAEAAVMSLEQMYIHSQGENESFSLEAHCVAEKLKDKEASKAILEERIINEHNVIIGDLREQNFSYDAKIKDMQNEMQLLKAAKEKLEYELSLNLEENKALRKEVNGLENSLSSANVEIEGLKVSSNALEAFCETLFSEISTHSVEKGVLVSHMENISDHMESLEVKNSFLENSLSDASMELETLKARFPDMEESCMSHCDKNTSLLSEKNNLVSQINNLESNLLALHEECINSEREKHLLQNHVQFLQKEYQGIDRDFEVEQHRSTNAYIENLVLQGCLYDMCDKNLFLSGEYQNLKRQHLELEKMMMTLEKENEDLETSLKLEKQEHNALISSSKSQISTLENQVDLAQNDEVKFVGKNLGSRKANKKKNRKAYENIKEVQEREKEKRRRRKLIKTFFSIVCLRHK